MVGRVLWTVAAVAVALGTYVALPAMDFYCHVPCASVSIEYSPYYDLGAFTFVAAITALHALLLLLIGGLLVWGLRPRRVFQAVLSGWLIFAAVVLPLGFLVMYAWWPNSGLPVFFGCVASMACGALIGGLLALQRKRLAMVQK